jgi:thymidine kinase
MMNKLFIHLILATMIFPATVNAFGRLEVICGPMFAGKSEEFIRRLRRADIANLKTLIFKPVLDTRADDEITSHNGNRLKAIPLTDPKEILNFPDLATYDVIAIDEAQFFSADILPVIRTLIAMNKRVIVAGLDLDYRSEPFGPMPHILALADTITKLQAICMVCGDDACRSQRIINGNPARYDDPLIMIGSEESYQPRCKKCYTILS